MNTPINFTITAPTNGPTSASVNPPPLPSPNPPSTRPSVRPMEAGDLEAVLAIEIASAPHPWTAGIFADELAQADSRRYVVAVDDDRVVGFCGLLLSLDEGHITNVAVDPTLRRRGIAHEMMVVTVRTAIAKSLRALTLEVRVSNKAAISLYQRFGFAPGGVRPRYYLDNGEDALIMWAHDIDTAAYGVRLAGLASMAEGK